MHSPLKSAVSAAFVFAIAGVVPHSAGAQNPAAMQAHIDSARVMAGSDVSPAIMKVLCDDPKQLGAFLGPIMMNPKTIPATKAFDNLYYLGTDFVGSWVLNTSEGIILFDALNNTKDAKEIIEPGLHSLGLDPKRLKYIVIMHGHGDHYGGAKYLQDKYHPKVIMSAADWDFAPVWLAGWIKAGGPAAAARFGDIPRRDLSFADGQKLKLGNTTVTLYVTPGHTPGTLSAIIPVKDNGVAHKLSFWGGTALPADSAGKRQYELSAARFLGIVDSANVDGVISNHPFIDGTIDKVRTIQGRKSGEGNPFVIGSPAVHRYMGVHLQCVRAAELR